MTVGERFRWRGREVALFDLSDTLDNATSAFEPNAHHIAYTDHVRGKEVGAELFASVLGMPRESTEKVFSRGHAWAVEEATISTHSGTHMDAPYHYGPEASGGSRPRTIDEVPLRWCFGDGVLLDMTAKDRVAGISREDVEAELRRIRYELKPFDIVLIRTDASKFFNTAGYDRQHPGLQRSATAYLVERGVRTIGIDAWGLDRAFDVMAGDVLRGAENVEFWETHLYGLEHEYAQLEKLANLDALPVTHGFTVMAFPYKIQGASAGWSRVVALVELG
ncbi:cyclase family protein [Deinococcus sp. HMF7620]|uniref:Cyclase family protein n=1 Tax=Deinococcus arboris TaxID=2682977 RepID=A0A7C9LNP4_9DEIO|nr:cyclase family protein [Deinococcus arboris]MVN88237.1 cyclase family protein [Deinococcus arboris]